MKTIYLDGQYLKVDDQIIQAFAPGSFKAKGAFETLLAIDGIAFDVSPHLNRLKQGLKVLKIKSPLVNQSIIKELLRHHPWPCARVRIMVWQAGRDVHVMGAVLAYQLTKNKNYQVSLIKTNRAATARWANVKSLDYELFAAAYNLAKSDGFDEALLLNSKGHIFEASRANIFWTKDNVLYTPPLSSGCLNGITRQQVMKQAAQLKILVKERNLTPQILKKAGTAFLTNSLIGIKPIDLVLFNKNS
jgi:branched-subunit amino acid aminotransferase/4-amino-4-deoxychorismate lyase